MNKVKILTLFCVGVLAAMLPQAKADQWNQKTVFTFSGPVEMPGGKILEPGTYVFKLVDSPSDRNIVQVYNQRENHLYGTFLAIANYRLKTRGKTILTFEERATGAPEAVRAWFYPGENYGHEFVYHKSRAVELAKTNKQTVASMSTEMSDTSADNSAWKQTPLTAETDTGEEVDIAKAYPPASSDESASADRTQTAAAEPAPPAPAPAPAESAAPIPEPMPAQTPAELPHTGSSYPLIGMIGLLSLGTAGLLRFATARSKQ